MLKPLNIFQNRIGYTFRNQAFLIEALTHKSFVHEKDGQYESAIDNERMEFLGDAVLDLAISQMLMSQNAAADEGELSKRRAALVNEKFLADLGREIQISDFIILGRGEINSNGRDKSSILAAAIEAVIGAIFLDSHFETAAQVICALFSDKQGAVQNTPFAKDYKTRLQELIQGKHKLVPHYKVDSTQGPDHEKTFLVSVYLGETKLCEGFGKSKKEAEQSAAKTALEDLVL